MDCIPRDTRHLIQVLDPSTINNKFPVFSVEDLRKVLINASRNRLLYAFSCRMIHNVSEGPRAKALASITLRGRALINRYKVALYNVNNLLIKSRVPFLIVKTVKSLPHVPSDIDVLVQPGDFFRALESLESDGRFTRCDEDLYGESKATFVFDHSINSTRHWMKRPWIRWDSYQGLKVTKVDLHTSLTWQGVARISPSFVWTSIRQVEMLGVRIPVPSKEADLTCGIASTLFDHRGIRLIDFLTMKDALASCLIDWSQIFTEARKHSWEIELFSYLELYSLLYNCIYGGDRLAFEQGDRLLTHIHVNSTSHDTTKLINFPFALPSGMVLRSLLRCGGPINVRLLSFFAFLLDRLRLKVGVGKADEFRWISDPEIFAINLQE